MSPSLSRKSMDSNQGRNDANGRGELGAARVARAQKRQGRSQTRDHLPCFIKTTYLLGPNSTKLKVIGPNWLWITTLSMPSRFTFTGLAQASISEAWPRVVTLALIRMQSNVPAGTVTEVSS